VRRRQSKGEMQARRLRYRGFLRLSGLQARTAQRTILGIFAVFVQSRCLKVRDFPLGELLRGALSLCFPDGYLRIYGHKSWDFFREMAGFCGR